MRFQKSQTLYEICLEHVVENSTFWIRDSNGIDGQKVNRLNGLPPRIQQDILDTYERLNGSHSPNKPWHDSQKEWRLFVTTNVSKVIITDYTEKISLEHIANTCKNLKQIEMKNVGEVLPYLKTLSPCLVTLTSLSFEPMAHLNGSSMKYIRSHCLKLRVLDVKSCFLNDKAIIQLKHMPSLMELDLRDTEVTSAGLCHILKYNSQITSLCHPEIGRALHKMHCPRTRLARMEASLLSPSVPYYRLCEIDVDLPEKYPSVILSLIVSVCPKIERVKLELEYRSSPISLLPLVKLERLTELIVQCVAESSKRAWEGVIFPSVSVDTPAENVSLFEGSILPIIQSHGQTLKTILLENVNGINMKNIECYCPNIASLGLYYNSYVPNSFSVPSDTCGPRPFPYLQRLLFGSNSDDSQFPKSYLLWLLSNKDLEELSFSNSPLFTEELFSLAFTNSESFPNLHRLELDYCNIAPEIVVEFLRRCGRKSLRELCICGPFVREQASPALCYILGRRLDVQVQAYLHTFMKMKKRIVRYRQDLNLVSAKPLLGHQTHQRCIHMKRYTRGGTGGCMLSSE